MEEEFNLAQRQLIISWANGDYALGWRGWLAAKLLRPVVNSELVRLSNLRFAPPIKTKE